MIPNIASGYCNGSVSYTLPTQRIANESKRNSKNAA
jgi:hypothetical protein